jgi:hypothetical protein
MHEQGTKGKKLPETRPGLNWKLRPRPENRAGEGEKMKGMASSASSQRRGEDEGNGQQCLKPKKGRRWREWPAVPQAKEGEKMKGIVAQPAWGILLLLIVDF